MNLSHHSVTENDVRSLNNLPSGYVKIANWKIAIEIVDLLMKFNHNDFP